MLLKREFGRGQPSLFLFVLAPAILVHGSFDAVVRAQAVCLPPAPTPPLTPTAPVCPLVCTRQSLVLGVLITKEIVAVVVVGTLSLAILCGSAFWLRRLLKRTPWDDYHRQYEERVARGEYMGVGGAAPQGLTVPMVQYVYVTPQGNPVSAPPLPQGGTVAAPPTVVTTTPAATESPQGTVPHGSAAHAPPPTSSAGGAGPATSQ